MNVYSVRNEDGKQLGVICTEPRVDFLNDFLPGVSGHIIIEREAEAQGFSVKYPEATQCK